jgi:integrase/recombinase XerD
MVQPTALTGATGLRGTEAMGNSQPGPAVSGVVLSTSQVRRLAVAAYLARFKGQSRVHTESDLRGYLTWCESRGLDPLAATRPHIEIYVRWLQEVRRYRPSTVSRRTSVVAGFYRTCVIDAVLEHSPAEYVRRPNVPAESPRLGLTHLQFEAMSTTAKRSPNRCDFALVTMLGGLLGRRIFDATGNNIEDLQRGARPTRAAAYAARAARSCSCRSRPPSVELWREPSATGPPNRSS